MSSGWIFALTCPQFTIRWRRGLISTTRSNSSRNSVIANGYSRYITGIALPVDAGLINKA
jgi:hypothetical protein